jgi:hypothetical protein
LLDSLGEHRNFDVAARFYEAPGLNEELACDAEYVLTGGLSKLHAAYQFITQYKLESAYEGFLFLDGDLEFKARELSSFLSLVQALGLDLAQPSVSRDSYSYWRMAYHQPRSLFRETSFVEVMAPYFSRSALEKTLLTFPRSISSYGLDHVWPSLIEHQAVGVVDVFQVRHRDRVDHVSGSFYKYLKSIGVDFNDEKIEIMSAFGVSPGRPYSRRGYFWADVGPNPAGARPLVSVPLFGVERFTTTQGVIDWSIRLAHLLPARSETARADRIRALFAPGNGFQLREGFSQVD